MKNLLILSLTLAACTPGDNQSAPDAPDGMLPDAAETVCRRVADICGPAPEGISPKVEVKDTGVVIMQKYDYLKIEEFRKDALTWFACVEKYGL